MSGIDRIEYNPRVCNGRPVIRGTRIPVSVVLERIASAESWTELIEAFPELEREDIEAAVLFAKSSIDNSDVRAVGG
jgi:uncharacterized protein (DUF433 family)